MSATAHHPASSHHRHHAAHAAANTAFLQQAAPAAQASETHTGVPASVTIAQAILESGWGRHHIGAANNYFGIKAHTRHGKIDVGTVATGYVNASTHEYVKGKKVQVIAHFRKYANMTQSFIDHGLFLRQNSRYGHTIHAYKANADADAFARGLQHAGYATDPHYAQHLIGLMQRHNLYQYNLPPTPAAAGAHK
jgi:flagellum-specific peptidoglycan hydrolase FlgJ